MKKLLILFLSALVFGSCTSKVEKIINESIAAHGGNSYEKLNIGFDFRGLSYSIKRDQGTYNYQRTTTDSLKNQIKDVLTNEGLQRYLNEEKTSIPDSMAVKYANSINSVAYFFLLPFGLNDTAVQKEYMNEIVIKGQSYHQIKVWFQEEGGGVDHQDLFMFWINTESKLLDYLAYSYETDGGGVRFREAYNRKKLNEFTFQDYRNYGFEDATYPLSEFPQAFENNELPLLSSIENENIKLKRGNLK